MKKIIVSIMCTCLILNFLSSSTFAKGITKNNSSSSKKEILMKCDKKCVKIKKISDICMDLDKGQEFELPEFVQVEMNDGTVRDMQIKWDCFEKIDTDEEGEYTFLGKVYGYNKEVIFKLNIIDENNDIY